MMMIFGPVLQLVQTSHGRKPGCSNTMGNKNDAWKRRKSGQMKFKARYLKVNKNTSSLINTSTIIGAENDVFTHASLDVVSSLQTASTKKLKGLLLTLLLVLLLKIMPFIT